MCRIKLGSKKISIKRGNIDSGEAWERILTIIGGNAPFSAWTEICCNRRNDCTESAKRRMVDVRPKVPALRSKSQPGLWPLTSPDRLHAQACDRKRSV